MDPLREARTWLSAFYPQKRNRPSNRTARVSLLSIYLTQVRLCPFPRESTHEARGSHDGLCVCAASRVSVVVLFEGFVSWQRVSVACFPPNNIFKKLESFPKLTPGFHVPATRPAPSVQRYLTHVMKTEPGGMSSRSPSFLLDMDGPSSLMQTVKLGEDG